MATAERPTVGNHEVANQPPPLVDYNLFEGTEVVGSPDVVLLRGNVLVENDELVASPGVGRYVARATFRKQLGPA